MLELSIEQQILIAMRKTLAAVVKDVTPLPGMKHPLSDSTIADIRACFALISAREQELARHDGRSRERPQYVDNAPSAQIIPLASLKRRTNQTDEH
ncbi:segregation and condensation protein A [Rhodoferax sp. 4810]|uniref:Segregation and condensation protein A n=1 Tax=Thiospirillum jenense TaxID=1653858 RepID=A0A839HF44_9GAMM|nr:segregation and condensation protein A [Thiospirillum jenense]MBB1077722.1 segregation and condensation protein A [Rhodoferax jenense]MBB1127281.1 segregation and condensation protein A [Thiospirillum jenense]